MCSIEHLYKDIYSQESSFHLKKKYGNLYSSVTGDWLTFTSPVERRKSGGERVRGEGAVFDRPTRHDGCVWRGRRAHAAGWKALLGLGADSAGWLSASWPDCSLELSGSVWQRSDIAPSLLGSICQILVIKDFDFESLTLILSTLEKSGEIYGFSL